MEHQTTAVVDNTSDIRHETAKSNLTVDKIYKADFQKEGTLTAQLRQFITTKSFYPSKKVASSLQENLFTTQDFGFGEQEFTSVEQRIAWIAVPPSATQAQIQEKLDAAFANGACIYRVLANKPILTEDQKYAINQGLKTMDDFANQQVVRYPENDETKAAGTAGKLTLDKEGNVQYRRTFFWTTKMEDSDARDKNEVYLSPELQAELSGASVMLGQNISG